MRSATFRLVLVPLAAIASHPGLAANPASVVPTTPR